MKRRVIETEDGSSTILIENWGENFHSIHGAIQEAQHVYIENGLRFVFQKNMKNIDILEIGFGTGLNCYMSFIETQSTKCFVSYTGIEGFPLDVKEWELLNYKSFFEAQYANDFDKMHQIDWEKTYLFNDNFSLTKHRLMFEDLKFDKQFDLVYFDAFGFQFQPELWTEEIFSNIKKAMKPNAVLVTYACKGEVNRILRKLGFVIEKLKGPPGKREMTRAVLSK